MGIYWRSVPTIQSDLWLRNFSGAIDNTVPPTAGTEGGNKAQRETFEAAGIEYSGAPVESE